MERSLGFFVASWAVLKATCAILVALVASEVRLGGHLGHLGRLGQRQGRVWASTEPREEGAMHADECYPEGVQNWQGPRHGASHTTRFSQQCDTLILMVPFRVAFAASL